MKVETLTNEELIQLVLDGKELTPSERLAVAALARRGAATQWQKRDDATGSYGDQFLVKYTDGSVGTASVWKGIKLSVGVTHAIPVSAIGTPEDRT